MPDTSDSVGRCHICQQIEVVRYCPRCDHFFCKDCRTKWFDRTWAFLKEKFGGKRPGCCGIMVS